MVRSASTPKASYSLSSNIAYALGIHWQAKKSTLLCCALAVVVGVAQPFVGMLLPKVVVDELTSQARPERFVAVVSALALLLMALQYLKGYTDVVVNESIGVISSYSLMVKRMAKQMTMDYEVYESPSFQKLGQAAHRVTQSNHTPGNNLPRALTRMLVHVLGLVIYGMVIVSIHPAIALLLALTAGINWLCLSKARAYEASTREERSKISSKLYHIHRATKDPAGAKDIRLYALPELFQDLFESLARQADGEQDRVAFRYLLAQLAEALLFLLRDGGAYAYLIFLLLGGQITLGNFVLIFSAIGTFASWVSGILLQGSELLRASNELTDLRAYLEAPDVSNTGPGAPLPKGGALPPGIRLRGVSYRYPEAQGNALENLNLDIRPGERIAVVGANGAGKTTLVKLICGLYQPTDGEIQLGDADVRAFNRDEYFSLFSTVFQDVHLLTCDIAGNVSQAPPEQTDSERVMDCLKRSGLGESLKKWKDREKTLLVRRVNDEAVELSGGEKQKLALARALYKDAPVLILDEPTAALDPLAESEVYRQFNDMMQGKTAIYISHRLASTRFCDRIFFIDDHRVAECGTHEELMALGGQYAEMFSVQAHYYQESGGKDHEA